MTTTTPIRLLVRPITARDNLAIANVIREVSAEFGLTADKGYTVSDPNLDHLYELYSQPRSAYWVIEVDGHIAGGGGVAPLLGGETDLCELQKMYFLPILRGKGLAKQLALQALAFARQQGFGRCYLETTASLTSAVGLYERLGFEHIGGAMGNTGHVDCEVTMLKTL
ncbi:GNAT family N-acetyltransferase [Yersinia pseudotuberculosis]|uniref:GCN5-related N-acetyltransferase n=1 Tax=Yersinia pseudotuberculosis serotype O:3 (strain YPIII) TaxID=502800 RepID=A0A0H3B7G8_YERPY|nr:GNAT family N-acetyltransferase [Yersinia pseudotuberculosis]AJJ59262.1 acetyltransferase domain protein [Yersinia pseudotuberculosis YPIII]AYW89514.1 GNAT family N-acetyltransferase [Yersinia pseudotuberculosis]AYX00263.1 GNAT family N-acetyltransferase [Yersinia pseudotuberculosis]AZA31828.1 GNAT family N-acetyltransferase [Yersinia pseudotuberculosis]MBK1423305.1 GNAT family N-acetyltransferase [Yersinia pseudotuberculosis]